MTTCNICGKSASGPLQFDSVRGAHSACIERRQETAATDWESLWERCKKLTQQQRSGALMYLFGYLGKSAQRDESIRKAFETAISNEEIRQ